jgi:4-amino-4-deoxy-L-arabinose transferase-like glycosyltransferase
MSLLALGLLYEHAIMSEAFFVPLLTYATFFLVWGMRCEQRRYYFICGLCLGLATLSRPIGQGVILLLPFVLFATWRNIKKTIKFSLITLVAYLLVTGPWMLHNYAVSGRPTITALAGHGLYHRTVTTDKLLNLDSGGPYRVVKELQKKHKDQTSWAIYRGLVRMGYSQSEIDRLFRGSGLEAIREHPFMYARNTLIYIVKMFSIIRSGEQLGVYEHPDRYTTPPCELYEGNAYVLTNDLAPMSQQGWQFTILRGWSRLPYPNYRHLFFVVLLGAILGLRFKFGPSLLFIALIFYIISVTALIQSPLGRYRLPVEPYLLIFFSWGLWWLLSLLPKVISFFRRIKKNE